MRRILSPCAHCKLLGSASATTCQRFICSSCLSDSANPMTRDKKWQAQKTRVCRVTRSNDGHRKKEKQHRQNNCTRTQQQPQQRQQQQFSNSHNEMSKFLSQTMCQLPPTLVPLYTLRSLPPVSSHSSHSRRVNCCRNCECLQ